MTSAASPTLSPGPAAPAGEPPLGELARRVRDTAGEDRAAGEALARALWPRLHLVLLRTERDRELAADLAQDAMLIVLDALATGRVEDPAAIAGYAAQVARSLATSAGRTRSRRAHLLAQLVEDVAAEAPALARVDLPALGRCVNALPFREKQAVFETFFLDREPDAIAATLATTAGNVRVIRHRALRSLRRCLGLEEVA